MSKFFSPSSTFTAFYDERINFSSATESEWGHFIPTYQFVWSKAQYFFFSLATRLLPYANYQRLSRCFRTSPYVTIALCPPASAKSNDDNSLSILRNVPITEPSSRTRLRFNKRGMIGCGVVAFGQHNVSFRAKVLLGPSWAWWPAAGDRTWVYRLFWVFGVLGQDLVMCREFSADWSSQIYMFRDIVCWNACYCLRAHIQCCYVRSLIQTCSEL